MAFGCGRNEVGHNHIDGFGTSYGRRDAIAKANADARRARSAAQNMARAQLQAHLDRDQDGPCPDECPRATPETTDEGIDPATVTAGPWHWIVFWMFGFFPIFLRVRIYDAQARAWYKEWIVCETEGEERPSIEI